MASGNYLVSFSDGTNTYTFPTFQSQLRDNFSDMVPRTVRIPGADGGFDQFGEDKAPSEIGNVSVSFEQYADSNEDLQTKRDLVRAMAAWGVATLTKDCGAQGTRRCSARVNSITMTEAPNKPIESQKLIVTVDFQVADPYWKVTNGVVSLPNVTKSSGSVNSTPNVVTPNGIFPVYPVFTFEADASVTDIYIGVQLAATGSGSVNIAACQFAIEGLVGAKRRAVIDCQNMTITIYNEFGVQSDGFANASWDYANFVKLEAGVAYNIFIYIVTAGNITESELDYVRNY